MPEPTTIAGALKAVFEIVSSIWKHGALLLWSCAAAALAGLVVLNVADRWNVEGAFQLERDCSLFLMLAVAVLAVFAIFKSYSERSNRPLSLIANEQRSNWGQARQPSGQVMTTISLNF